MSNAQAVVERDLASDSTAIIQVIERAAANPNVDIDKMERLLQMQERILDRNARAAYATALAEMQPKLPVVERKGNIVIHKKDAPKVEANIIQSTPYALWEDINEAIRPLLAEYGFALSFRMSKEADRVVVTGILMHREGHSEETTLSLPMDTTGSKNNVQAIGSSTSYGKRYTAMALLNITTRGDDDDGKAAGVGPVITDDQRQQLDDMLTSTNSDDAKFLSFFGIEYLAELPSARFAEALTMLRQKQARK